MPRGCECSCRALHAAAPRRSAAFPRAAFRARLHGPHGEARKVSAYFCMEISTRLFSFCTNSEISSSCVSNTYDPRKNSSISKSYDRNKLISQNQYLTFFVFAPTARSRRVVSKSRSEKRSNEKSSPFQVLQLVFHLTSLQK